VLHGKLRSETMKLVAFAFLCVTGLYQRHFFLSKSWKPSPWRHRGQTLTSALCRQYADRVCLSVFTWVEPWAFCCRRYINVNRVVEQAVLPQHCARAQSVLQDQFSDGCCVSIQPAARETHGRPEATLWRRWQLYYVCDSRSAPHWPYWKNEIDHLLRRFCTRTYTYTYNC
jgi:hypothetical protein